MIHLITWAFCILTSLLDSVIIVSSSAVIVVLLETNPKQEAAYILYIVWRDCSITDPFDVLPGYCLQG